MLTAARLASVIACILVITLAPWWACAAAGGITIWLFSIPDPPPRRAYIRDRQILVMTEREASQRNAALAANGLEERWQ